MPIFHCRRSLTACLKISFFMIILASASSAKSRPRELDLSGQLKAALSSLVAKERGGIGSANSSPRTQARPVKCDDMSGQWNGKCRAAPEDGGDTEEAIRIHQIGCDVFGVEEDIFTIAELQQQTKAGSESSVTSEIWEWNGSGKVLQRFMVASARIFFQDHPSFQVVNALQNYRLEGDTLVSGFSGKAEIHYEGRTIEIKKASLCHFTRANG